MEWIKRELKKKIPLIILIGLIVGIIGSLCFLSGLGQSSQSQPFDDTHQEMIIKKCEAQIKRQWYIDTMEKSDSIRIKKNKSVLNSGYLYSGGFVGPDKLNLELAKINLILSGDPVNCKLHNNKIHLK